VIEKILKDRMVSIAGYEDKLKKDLGELSGFGNVDNEEMVEYRVSIEEVLTFIEQYKVRMDMFLTEGQLTIEEHTKHLGQYDSKFFKMIRLIQSKEEAFRSIRN
jgi:hypothetical protein